jgi:glycosyltransferase involved in cell wall biosynthesis
LAIGRLLYYKRFDLIISAFGRLGYLLKIVGDGPELNRLKARAKKMRAFNIEFIPFLKDENELRKLYNGARALVFPQVEDFGLVAAEAQACGAPVIAYAGGGVLEVVQAGETGIFFEKQEPKSLIEAVQKFEKTQFNREKIADLSKRFSKERFKKEVGIFVRSAYAFLHPEKS